MKKIRQILLLLFLLNSFQGKAQTYYPLVKDSVHWLIARDPGAFGINTYGSIFEYFSIGDTIVSSTTYKKVYKRNIQSINNYYAPYQSISAYTLFALLREDTANRKVYAIILQSVILNCSTNQEVLLYDFNLNIGDTLNSCTSITPLHPCPEITSITPAVRFGYNTIIYKLGNCNPYTLYYEGIGGWDGLFEDENFVITTALWEYCVGSDMNCGITTNIIESTNNKSFYIYPNPTTGIIQIKPLNQLDFLKEELHVSINNVFGKVVKHLYLNSLDKIDITNLEKGIYFLKIDNQQSETIHYTKIIKL